MPVQVESPKNILMTALAERGYTRSEQLRLLSGVQEMMRQGGQNPQMPAYCQPQWYGDMQALYSRWQEVAPNVRSVDALDAETTRKLLRDELGASIFGRAGAVPEAVERTPPEVTVATGPAYQPSREAWRSMIPKPSEPELLSSEIRVSQERPEQQAAPQTTYRYGVEMQGRLFTFETTHYFGENTTLADVRQLYEKDPLSFTRITTAGAEQPRGVFAVFLRAADDEAARQGKTVPIMRVQEQAAPRVFLYNADFVTDDGTRYSFTLATSRGFDLHTIHDINRALELFGDRFLSVEATVTAPDGSQVMVFRTPQELVGDLASMSLQRSASIRSYSVNLAYIPPAERPPVEVARTQQKPAVPETPVAVAAPERAYVYQFETPSQRFVFETSAPLPSLNIDDVARAFRGEFGGTVAVREIYLAGAATPVTLRRREDLEARDDAPTTVAGYIRMIQGLLDQGVPVPVRVSQVISG